MTPPVFCLRTVSVAEKRERGKAKKQLRLTLQVAGEKKAKKLKRTELHRLRDFITAAAAAVYEQS